jgi:hypothetical protein
MVMYHVVLFSSSPLGFSNKEVVKTELNCVVSFGLNNTYGLSGGNGT